MEGELNLDRMEKQFSNIREWLVNNGARTGLDLLLLMSCNTTLELIEYIKESIGVEKISLVERNKHLRKQVARLEDQIERITCIICGP